MSATALKYITPAEYRAMEALADEKHEYFDGHIIAMAGAREAHNRIVANLIREIGVYLKGKSCDVFPSDLRITTPGSNSYMYPDISIVCGEMEKKDDDFDACTNPSIIIEVMSDSTRDNDRGYKFFYYQQIPSLKEYLLIDSTNYLVQCIQKQPDDSWKFTTISDVHSSVVLQTIGLTVQMADAYYKVSFA